jgi:hypothetical protein
VRSRIIKILKKENFWWVPIFVLILSGLGFIFKEQFTKADSPSTIIGSIRKPPIVTRAILDMEKETKVHKESGFFRFDNVKRGQHIIECRCTGYNPVWAFVNIEGGKENFSTSSPLHSSQRKDFQFFIAA